MMATEIPRRLRVLRAKGNGRDGDGDLPGKG